MVAPPRRRISRVATVLTPALALVASLGLAGLSRPSPDLPRSQAARFVAPSGTRVVLDPTGEPTVVETSRHTGIGMFSDATLAGMGALTRMLP